MNDCRWKLNLITYYRSHFNPEIEAKSQAYVGENKNTLSRLQNISLEQRLGNSEERILRVENSIHEMQSSIKDELTTFRQSMEVIMEVLQGPESSTPLTRRAPLKVKRVERQLVKLNDIESECRKAVEEIVTQIEDDELAANEIEKWEDVRAQIVQAEDQAELYIGRNKNISQCP